MSAPSATEPEDPTGVPPARGFLAVTAGRCALLLAVLLAAGFVCGAFQSSLLVTLQEASRLFDFLANLVVVLYAFPAFIRTKNRAFLCLAAAALGFGYGALFSILVSIGPPATTAWRMSLSEARWYYIVRHTVSLIGLVLYAYGIISLARHAKTKA